MHLCKYSACNSRRLAQPFFYTAGQAALQPHRDESALLASTRQKELAYFCRAKETWDAKSTTKRKTR